MYSLQRVMFSYGVKGGVSRMEEVRCDGEEEGEGG